MATTKELEEGMKALPKNFTMRDIFDFCTRFHLQNLAQGMIELPPPLKLRQIAADLCVTQDPIHQYRNRLGEEDYRKALQKLLEKHYHVKIPLECILATSGVSGAIFSTLSNLRSEKGTQARVGIMVPFYTYHVKQITEAFGKEPVYVNTNEDFSPNWENIENALKGGLDLLMVCNPGNPQGNVWTKENMDKLVSLTAKYNSLLLVDEIYCDLVWEGQFYSPINDKIHDHVIVCRGFSKTLGAQSWRCAFLISSPQVTTKIMRIHDPIYINVPWLQHALAKYLDEEYPDFVSHIKQVSELMQENWKILSKALQEVLGWEPIEPSGSMYGMFKHHSKSDSDAVMDGLRLGVGVAPGNIFFPGLPENTGYVRIHCGITLEKANAIAKLLKEKKSS